MGSAMDHVGMAGGRAKKASGGSQLWKKALLYSSLCFVMGFFTGFAPSSVSDWRSVAPAGVGSSHMAKTPQVIAWAQPWTGACWRGTRPQESGVSRGLSWWS
uniref:Uncharacterized protein n=1 Tax=Aegilops tauschii subsp. strangulata TaxID=200361 RepID=A0A453SX94_AEGTS